jgi:hypothetical protein
LHFCRVGTEQKQQQTVLDDSDLMQQNPALGKPQYEECTIPAWGAPVLIGEGHLLPKDAPNLRARKISYLYPRDAQSREGVQVRPTWSSFC